MRLCSGAPGRRARRQGRQRGGNRRGPGSNSRPDVGAGVPRRTARCRFHSPKRALGSTSGHLRHVGGGQRAGRVLHLRLHPDERLPVHVHSGSCTHRHRQPLLLLAGGLLAAGSAGGDDRLRHQSGGLWTERLAPDLLLQLGDADRLRSRGPHPHRRCRSGPHHQGRLLVRRPGQGDPGRRRRADSGDPAVPRTCDHRQIAPLPDHPLRDPLRHPLGIRHPARALPRGTQRGLADLHRGTGLRDRPERPRMDRVRQRLHQVLSRRHVEEGHRRMGLPGYGGTRDPHHDAGRSCGDLRGRESARAPGASCRWPTRASSRPGSSWSS